jgi:beta-lactamase regulating signal transducer with metallopeptidase domain
MDLLHLHLILNHVPVIGAGILLLLLAGAVWRRSGELMRAALVLAVVLGAVALGAFFTGEPAENGLKDYPGVTERKISAHEDAAEMALTSIEVLAALALLGLVVWRKQPGIPGWFAAVIVFVALVTSGMMGWTANLGGKIRHTELGGSAPAVTQGEGD